MCNLSRDFFEIFQKVIFLMKCAFKRTFFLRNVYSGTSKAVSSSSENSRTSMYAQIFLTFETTLSAPLSTFLWLEQVREKIPSNVIPNSFRDLINEMLKQVQHDIWGRFRMTIRMGELFNLRRKE